jgi:peptidoglycan/LPS O-acetylase OafA/YrhL
VTPAGRNQPSLSYRADIDGLRAIAVLLVVIFHFDLFSLGEAGFIGVDVFFVISGFLITSILTRQLDDGTFSMSGFYLARVRRLAPALIAVLLTTLAVGSAFLFADDFMELSRQVFVSQFYVANIYFWRHVNYFGLGKDNVFLLHMWSLAVEEQFYLLYPIALLWLHRRGRQYFWWAIMVGFAVSFALNIAFVARKPEATFYLLPTRAWELFAGALIPLVTLKWRRSRLADEMLGIAGLSTIATAVLCYAKDLQFPGFFALLPVTGSVCVLLSGASGQTGTSKLLSYRAATYIGKISYPLYLVHWPVNVFAGRLLNEEYGLGWRYAMFGTSLLLASSIYHLVEHPLRRRQWWSLKRHLLEGYGAGLVLTISIVVTIEMGHGLPQRFPAEVNRLASFVNDRPPPLDECEFSRKTMPREPAFCHIGSASSKPTWLIYGDSHAWAAHAALDKWLQSRGEAGLFVFRHSCPPVIGVHLFQDKGDCFAFNQAVAEFLANDRDVANVLLISTWRQAIEARLSTSEAVLLSREESIRLFDQAFAETLTHLHRLRKRVYVWEPVPGAKRNVPLALARAELAKRPAHIEISRQEYLDDNKFFFAALQKNRSLVALSFSPSNALCRSGKCAVTIDGNPAYFDNAHMANSSSDFWVRMMQNDERLSRSGEVRALSDSDSAIHPVPVGHVR